MPINTVQQRLLTILHDLPMPQRIPPLQAFIEPLNPDTQARRPKAFIWGSRGVESRLSVPRAQPANLASGGNKQIEHQEDIWLLWFGRAGAANADTAFPAIIDATMAALRNAELLDEVTVHAVDPVTGQRSDLLAIGEDMSWQYSTLRSVADQRILRYDAQITCTVIEVIQA